MLPLFFNYETHKLEEENDLRHEREKIKRKLERKGVKIIFFLNRRMSIWHYQSILFAPAFSSQATKSPVCSTQAGIFQKHTQLKLSPSINLSNPGSCELALSKVWYFISHEHEGTLSYSS